MSKKITILGAGGKMGQWLTKFFSAKGFEVTGYDAENKITGKSIIKSDSLIMSIILWVSILLITVTLGIDRNLSPRPWPVDIMNIKS